MLRAEGAACMSGAWTTAERAFRFTAGPLCGTLERTDDARSLRIVLGGVRIGALGDLHWTLEDGGAKGSTQPIADVAYLQLPYVVAPFALNTPAGLRLTAFFRATEDGVDLDFRLATVETLANVSLDLAADWPAFRSPGEWSNPRLFPGVAAGIVDLGGRSAGLLIDVGEHGVFSPTPNGATLRLFNQGLEKGVILVGRVAIRPFVDEERLRRDLEAWLDHPSASL
jgi:hypothetical protein